MSPNPVQRVVEDLLESNYHFSSWKDISMDEDGVVSCDSWVVANNLFHGPNPVKWGTVRGFFHASGCDLTTPANGPRVVMHNYDISNNPLTDLKGLPKHVKGRVIVGYDPNLPLLNLLTIKGSQQLQLTSYPNSRCIPDQIVAQEILQKYYDRVQSNIMACAAALIKAGLHRNASLCL